MAGRRTPEAAYLQAVPPARHLTSPPLFVVLARIHAALVMEELLKNPLKVRAAVAA